MDTPRTPDDTFKDRVLDPTNLTAAKSDRNDAFYFTDVIFLVEGQLFKVPRRNFAAESEVFADMFQLPPPGGEGTPLDGSSDDQPLRLDGIKRNEFIQLLRVMFQLGVECDPLTVREWTSVLKLATMWNFQKIRVKAIKSMDKMTLDLVDKVIIAQKFDVSTWMVPTLNALAQRDEMINLPEANQLGMDWVLKLAKVRERGISSASEHRTCTNCNHVGPARCNSCNSTTANRCGSCNVQLPNAPAQTAPGARAKSNYADDIREVFGLA